MEKNKTSPNYVQLMKTVVEHSESPLMEVARAEWFITAYYKEKKGVTCLCGHEKCKYVFIIKNYNNNNLLAPIGSSCMQYFEWDGQEKTVLGAYEKWHFKKYRNPGLKYDQIEFNEVIKDVEYVRMIQRNPTLFHSAEHKKLICYAKAVWMHNPPLIPPPSVCQKCVEQQKIGYKKCYKCYIKLKK